MLHFALNSICAPTLAYRDFIALAQGTGCGGVEFRNDLQHPVFGEDSGAAARELCEEAGLTIYALAELKAFNRCNDETLAQARDLAQLAVDCGANAIVLIPDNSATGPERSSEQADLLHALSQLKPVLDDHGLIGLIEPLGFRSSSLRRKSDAVMAINELEATDTFQLVHDTFHHHLAGEKDLFPRETGIVHISGVSDPSVDRASMRDAHRGLVDRSDHLGTVKQLVDLQQGGFEGPVSFEPFAPQVHAFTDPKSEILRSIHFITTELAARQHDTDAMNSASLRGHPAN